MGLYVPAGNDYRWQLSSQQGVRPAAAYGDTVTPGNNTKGSWVQIFSAAEIANEVWAVLINVNSIAVSAAAKDALVDIGIGGAGAEVTWLPNLLCSCASPYNVGSGGVWYYFPIGLASGTRISARGQVNNATVGTIRVVMWVFGRPRNPETTRRGWKVEAIGVDTANSRGTVITPGTTSDGAWTLLGATTRRAWWWQQGFGTNDSTMTAAALHLDLSAGTAGGQKMLIEDQVICVTTAEQINNAPFTAGCTGGVASGTNIYGRAQSSAAADTQPSMAAYALEG